MDAWRIDSSRELSYLYLLSLPLSLAGWWAPRSRYRGPRCNTVSLSPHSPRDSTGSKNTRAYLSNIRLRAVKLSEIDDPSFDSISFHVRAANLRRGRGRTVLRIFQILSRQSDGLGESPPVRRCYTQEDWILIFLPWPRTSKCRE